MGATVHGGAATVQNAPADVTAVSTDVGSGVGRGDEWASQQTAAARSGSLDWNLITGRASPGARDSLEAAVFQQVWNSAFGNSEYALVEDGNYGSRTAAAVAAAQRALGMEATGTIDRSFLERLASASVTINLAEAEAAEIMRPQSDRTTYWERFAGGPQPAPVSSTASRDAAAVPAGADRNPLDLVRDIEDFNKRYKDSTSGFLTDRELRKHVQSVVGQLDQTLVQLGVDRNNISLESLERLTPEQRYGIARALREIQTGERGLDALSKAKQDRGLGGSILRETITIGGSILGAAAAGFIAGSVVPGAGNVLGGVTGLVVGIVGAFAGGAGARIAFNKAVEGAEYSGGDLAADLAVSAITAIPVGKGVVAARSLAAGAAAREAVTGGTSAAAQWLRSAGTALGGGIRYAPGTNVPMTVLNASYQHSTLAGLGAGLRAGGVVALKAAPYAGTAAAGAGTMALIHRLNGQSTEPEKADAEVAAAEPATSGS